MPRKRHSKKVRDSRRRQAELLQEASAATPAPDSHEKCLPVKTGRCRRPSKRVWDLRRRQAKHLLEASASARLSSLGNSRVFPPVVSAVAGSLEALCPPGFLAVVPTVAGSPAKEFKNLKSLDLFNNEATNMDNYREKVFSLIPSLQNLDGTDIDNREGADSEGEDDEVNRNGDGNSDANEDDGKDVSDGEEEDDLDAGVGLETVYKNLDNDSDEKDLVIDEDEEDDDKDAEQEGEMVFQKRPSHSEPSPVRGKKRKHEDGGESGN